MVKDFELLSLRVKESKKESKIVNLAKLFDIPNYLRSIVSYSVCFEVCWRLSQSQRGSGSVWLLFLYPRCLVHPAYWGGNEDIMLPTCEESDKNFADGEWFATSCVKKGIPKNAAFALRSAILEILPSGKCNWRREEIQDLWDQNSRGKSILVQVLYNENWYFNVWGKQYNYPVSCLVSEPANTKNTPRGFYFYLDKKNCVRVLVVHSKGQLNYEDIELIDPALITSVLNLGKWGKGFDCHGVQVTKDLLYSVRNLCKNIEPVFKFVAIDSGGADLSKPNSHARLTTSLIEEHPSSSIADSPSSQSTMQLTTASGNVVILEEKLTNGGYSVVYRGNCKGQVVVVKLFCSSSPLANLQRELAVMSLFNSHYLMKCSDFVAAPNKYALVMDYMEKGSLWDWLDKNRNKPLSQDQQLQIAREIIEGLSVLHHCSFIHRDIKSRNVLIGADDHAKLTDFGLVEVETVGNLEGSVVDSKVIVGTLAWVAPEVVVSGKHSKLSDIYSLGLILWQLVTCQEPFADKTVEAIRHSKSRGQHEVVPEHCSPRFSEMIAWCWAPPESRRTAKMLLENLSKASNVSSGPHLY